MARNGESTYKFARWNPNVAVFLVKFGRSLFLTSGIMCVVLWATNTATLSNLIWLEAFVLLMGLVFGLRYGYLSYRLGKGVVLTPGGLVVKQWMSRQEYPWQDVESIALETWEQRNKSERQWGSAFLRGDSALPYVKITLRRSIRFALWGGWFGHRMGTRVLGIGVPGTKKMALYLEEAEKFVEDAQRFLVMAPPPAMSP